MSDCVVCAECGLVQEMNPIDFRGEWRNFYTDDCAHEDASRVGDMHDKKLATTIAGKGSWKLQQMNERLLMDSKNIINIHKLLQETCRIMQLPDSIFYSAKVFAEDFLRTCVVRSEHSQHSVASACLYYACYALNGGVRTVDEIAVAVATAEVESSSSTAAKMNHVYAMLNHVYTHLLETFPAKYKDVLRLPQRDTDGDTVRGLIACVQDIPAAMRQVIFKRVMVMRDLLAQDTRLVSSEPTALNAFFIYMGCIMHGIKVVDVTICKQLAISQTTLHNKQNAMRDILQSDSNLAAKIMRV